MTYTKLPENSPNKRITELVGVGKNPLNVVAFACCFHHATEIVEVEGDRLRELMGITEWFFYRTGQANPCTLCVQFDDPSIDDPQPIKRVGRAFEEKGKV